MAASEDSDIPLRASALAVVIPVIDELKRGYSGNRENATCSGSAELPPCTLDS